MNARLDEMLSQRSMEDDFGQATLVEGDAYYFVLDEGELVIRLRYESKADEIRLISEVGEIDDSRRLVCLDYLLAANFDVVGERSPVFSYDRVTGKIYVGDFSRWTNMDYWQFVSFLRQFSHRAIQWKISFSDPHFWERLDASAISAEEALAIRI